MVELSEPLGGPNGRAVRTVELSDGRVVWTPVSGTNGPLKPGLGFNDVYAANEYDQV
jgi:hypothetical protein